MPPSSCRNFVKNRDRYPMPILLTFKKRKYHQTVIGGILSMIAMSLFLVYLADEFYKIALFHYTQTV